MRGTPPRWAQNLLERIARDYGVLTPALHWPKTRIGRTSATGGCDVKGRNVVVRAGRDKMDSRITLIHEMAHHVLCHTVSSYEGEHSEEFYDFLWPLFRRYRIPMRAALASETSNRETVLATYRKAGGRLKAV